ncbi:MAG TPA: plastocyanin/azurin family copper-binding protein [Gemmatimonadota bacterium]|nr:plastocyanin/azurin family copper-binding protein [Gemmatimonadota bacterium]
MVEVQLINSTLRFDPAELTIAPGTTVRWVHQAGSLFHTVTPEGHDEWQEAGRSSQGVVLEHTFQTAGEFPYFCEPHRSAGMVGSVSVE